MYLKKTRVGAESEQIDVPQYLDESGKEKTLDFIDAGSHVLIADDFTNSGSTLLKGAGIVRKKVQGGHAEKPLVVEAFVTQ